MQSRRTEKCEGTANVPAMWTRCGAVLAAGTVLLVSATGASAIPPGKLSPELVSRSSSGQISVIIQFHQAPGASDVAKVAQRGGALRRNLRSIRAGVYTVPPSALAAIAGDPNVRYISPDRTVRATLEFAGPTVGADVAFNWGWTGAGVGVAVLDSGISSEHADLKPRVVYAQSFVNDGRGTEDPYGHGTHVSGIVGGNGMGSTGPSYTRTFRGIAPKANLINMRVLDATGQSTDSVVVSAIERSIELKSAHNIRVLNLSLGRTIRESCALDPLCQAVQRAWEAGLVVVVAAGNNGRDNSMGTSGYATITSPANSPYAITVGAMKDMSSVNRGDDLMASYSSKGPTLLDHFVKPDLIAPGNNIVSALAPGAAIRNLYPSNVVPVSYYKVNSTLNVSSSYFRLSGTSMATPMVSGAAALLLEKNSSLTPDQVKARLMKTATKILPSMSISIDNLTGAAYPITYDLFTVGAGYLDIAAALNDTELSAGSAMSPVAWFNPETGVTSVFMAPGSVWNSAVMWGTAIIWGTNVMVNNTAVMWGTAVIWGTTNSEALAVIWGTAVMWGTSAPPAQVVSVRGET